MPLLRKDGKDLLFIHIPKCGGTSLEKLFSDNVEMSLFHSGPGELHCSPQHFHASLLEDLFDYRVPPAVTIVRNPFGRLVSEYRYQRQNGLSENIAFDQFVENSFGEYWKNSYVYDNHIRTQTQFITAETTIFRFEEAGVDAARKYIDDYLGIPSGKKITKENVSRKLDFLIAPETLRLINSFYHRDFELLGYAQIQPGKKPKKLSSLSYSPQPASDLTPSKFIRQKVLHDKTLVVEGTVNRMTADLERAEKDRKSAEDAVSNIEKELKEQSLANSALASKLDQRLAGLEELFKGSVTSLLEEALSKQETSARKLQEAVKNSLENVGDELAGLHQIQSLATVVEELDKSVIRYRDEATNESTELATHLEKLVSERESSYRNILKNFTESYSVHNTEMTELLEDIQSESKSTGAFLESKLTRLDSYLGSNAKTFEAVQKNIGQVLTTVARGFDSRKSNELIQKTVQNARFAELIESLGVMRQDLGKTGSDVITAVNASRALVADFMTVEHETWLLTLANTEKLAEAGEKIIEDANFHANAQKSFLSFSFDELKQEIQDSRVEDAALLERILDNLGQKFEHLENCQDKNEKALEQRIAVHFKALNEFKENEIVELGSQLANARANESSLNIRLETNATHEAKQRREIAALMGKSSELKSERDSVMQENESLKKSVAQLERAKVDLTANLQDVLARFNAEIELRSSLESKTISLENDVAQLASSEVDLRTTLQSTLERFDAEIEYRSSIQARAIRLENDVARLTQHNRALMESTSFRITRPLRTLSTTLKGLSSGNKRPKKSSAEILRLESPALTRVNSLIPSVVSQLDIAIVVENLDRGGLEQVVLDHARYFSSHCRSVHIYVINETGHVYNEAIAHGINVFRVQNDEMNMPQHLSKRKYDYTFFHHSYGYIPAFRPATAVMIEVIHNEYSWQLDNIFFNDIRANNIDKFIAVSEPVRQYSIANLSIREGSIVAIVNGLNTEGLIRPPVEVMREYRTTTVRESPTFIMCANGQPQKNHVLVIRAFSRLLKKNPTAQLLLPGNLGVNEEVESAILAELKQCGDPSNIKLLGSLDRRELSKHLATSHIALLPTKYEGFSIATLEYLYFGLPMILSNTGGAEYIESKFGSVIVDKSIVKAQAEPHAAEVRSLTKSMSKMIAQYDFFAEKSAAAAISYADYSVEAACSEYLNIKL